MIFFNKQEFLTYINALSGAAMGIDIGSKKIGLAITDPGRMVASPYKVIGYDVDQIISIIKEKSVIAIVAGLPLNMDGTEGSQCEFVKITIMQILAKIDIPVLLIDERLTTKMADGFMRQGNIKRKERNEKDDMVSAAIILDSGIF